MITNNAVNDGFNEVTTKNKFKANLGFLFSVMVLVLVMSAMTHAGTDTTFDGWVTNMEDWIKGSLGKGVSIAFVIVGIVMGVVRQSLMAFAIGIGAALGLNYTPTIIGTMFTAFL